MIVRRLLPLVLVGLVAITGAYAVWHAQRYRVSLFSPAGLPSA